jgi:hypothetical protein
VLLCGCHQSHRQTQSATVGVVTPCPVGCIHWEFVDPKNDKIAIRDTKGNLTGIITPIDRSESLVKKWDLLSFENAINTNENKKLKDKDFETARLPGLPSWKALKPYLDANDEIWTFGLLDVGFVVLRQNRIYCLVIINHSM